VVDGLPPGEGAFLACSFWLADNFILQGYERRVRGLLDQHVTAFEVTTPSAARREWDRALATLLYPAYERQGPRGKVCLDAEWW
jgi:hypothetical protein